MIVRSCLQDGPRGREQLVLGNVRATVWHVPGHTTEHTPEHTPPLVTTNTVP